MGCGNGNVDSLVPSRLLEHEREDRIPPNVLQGKKEISCGSTRCNAHSLFLKGALAQCDWLCPAASHHWHGTDEDSFGRIRV